MLIKVMTNRNTERLIAGVEEVDIHRGRYFFTSDAELQDTENKGAGEFNAYRNVLGYRFPQEIITFDSSLENRQYGQSSGFAVQFVDFKKDGQWHRLAVECFAYICNDEGRTISKVVVE